MTTALVFRSSSRSPPPKTRNCSPSTSSSFSALAWELLSSVASSLEWLSHPHSDRCVRSNELQQQSQMVISVNALMVPRPTPRLDDSIARSTQCSPPLTVPSVIDFARYTTCDGLGGMLRTSFAHRWARYGVTPNSTEWARLHSPKKSHRPWSGSRRKRFDSRNWSMTCLHSPDLTRQNHPSLPNLTLYHWWEMLSSTRMPQILTVRSPSRLSTDCQPPHRWTTIEPRTVAPPSRASFCRANPRASLVRTQAWPASSTVGCAAPTGRAHRVPVAHSRMSRCCRWSE